MRGEDRDTSQQAGPPPAAAATAAAQPPRAPGDRGQPPPGGTDARLDLGARLVALDAVAATLGWGTVLIAADLLNRATPALSLSALRWTYLGVIVTFLALRREGLYHSPEVGLRSIEIKRLAEACVLAAAGTYILSIAVRDQIRLREAAAAGLLSLLALLVARGIYRQWIDRRRRAGLFAKSLVLVADEREAAAVLDLFKDHPESGLHIVGAVGPDADARLAVPVVGHIDGVVDVVRDTRAAGVLVAARSLRSEQLNELVRELLAAGIPVHMWTGLQGLAYDRIRALPLAYEPLLYLEPTSLSRSQVIMKRVIDVCVASVVLLLTAPVWLLAALAIKLEDRGPVLFRQTRVGRHGQPFLLWKLRTMVVDAEERFDEVRHRSQREESPLFKLQGDPRVTRVGRFLRVTSIDELPQLVNVVQGTMSLVGPRPALPSEAQQFDPVLQLRTMVKPGVTGLWQVEARDNPAFGPYRRLDLFYVDNWSVGLDLSIIVATAFTVLGRTALALVPGRRPAEGMLD